MSAHGQRFVAKIGAVSACFEMPRETPPVNDKEAGMLNCAAEMTAIYGAALANLLGQFPSKGKPAVSKFITLAQAVAEAIGESEGPK